MSVTATIGELRSNFREVRRKMEEHGTVVITDNGVPSYQLTSLPPPRGKGKMLPDYAARLRTQRSQVSSAHGQLLHAENRGQS